MATKPSEPEPENVKWGDRRPYERIAKRLDPWCRWAGWPAGFAGVALILSRSSVLISNQLHGVTVHTAMHRAENSSIWLYWVGFALSFVASIPGAFRTKAKILRAWTWVLFAPVTVGLFSYIAAIFLGQNEELRRKAAGQGFVLVLLVTLSYLGLLVAWEKGYFKWLKYPIWTSD